MNHLEKAKDKIKIIDELDLARNIPVDCEDVLVLSHALIAIAEQLVIANEFKRIELENVEGLKVKMKDLPLWFRNKE